MIEGISRRVDYQPRLEPNSHKTPRPGLFQPGILITGLTNLTQTDIVIADFARDISTQYKLHQAGYISLVVDNAVGEALNGGAFHGEYLINCLVQDLDFARLMIDRFNTGAHKNPLGDADFSTARGLLTAVDLISTGSRKAGTIMVGTAIARFSEAPDILTAVHGLIAEGSDLKPLVTLMDGSSRTATTQARRSVRHPLQGGRGDGNSK